MKYERKYKRKKQFIVCAGSDSDRSLSFNKGADILTNRTTVSFWRIVTKSVEIVVDLLQAVSCYNNTLTVRPWLHVLRKGIIVFTWLFVQRSEQIPCRLQKAVSYAV